MNISNRNGRALEIAYLLALMAAAKLYGVNIHVEKNSSFHTAKSAWESTPKEMQKVFLLSATAGVNAILEAEPMILEQGFGDLEVKIQPDSAGQTGDVRDVLIIKHGRDWEIGISVKNNHFAVKHSRLSSRLDFGDKWFGIPCSQKYWGDIEPVFAYLTTQKKNKLAWNELQSKDENVYIPLLTAFLDEIERSYITVGADLPRNMVEYLIGKHDFYKAIGINKRRLTQVQPYNIRGTLGKASNQKRSKYIIPISPLPSRILHAGFKPESTTTVEVRMDEGWQFGFRIHNASTLVEASLKFDIQIIGMPASIMCIESEWM